MGNARQFSMELKKWGKDLTEEKASAMVRTIALDLLKRVTLKSPVDTGRFRANWMVGIGGADTTTTEETENVAVSRGQKVLSRYKRPDKAVVISNNLEYALDLEFGRSNQAPDGVLAISVMEVGGID